MGDIRAPDNKNSAYDDYMDGMKYKDIASKYNVSIATVKSWKTRYKWDRKSMHTKQEENKKVCIQKIDDNKIKSKRVAKKIVGSKNSELTEKQRLFCIHYVKSKNATLAAIKAGYSKDSAYVEGSRLLRNAKVIDEVKKLKVAITEELLIDEIDIINEYMRIAFADIGNYVEFGTEEVETEFGMVNKSYVRFKQDMEVDSSIISEVSIGKDGAKLKLYDKMKALEFIYDKVNTDKIEKQKLLIEKLKLDISNMKGDSKDKSNESWANTLVEIAKRRKERGSNNG